MTSTVSGCIPSLSVDSNCQLQTYCIQTVCNLSCHVYMPYYSYIFRSILCMYFTWLVTVDISFSSLCCLDSGAFTALFKLVE